MSLQTSTLIRLRGALFDGGAEGRNALLRKAVAPASRTLDRLLALQESSTDGDLPPCVLLCCPPRTGSTFIYQVLARVVPCTFVANIHQLAPRLGTNLLSLRQQGRKKTNKLVSYYGHTRYLTDVNEGNEFVDYWFRDNSVENIRNRFRETLSWLGASSERPAIIKNVAVYDRLSRLHEAIPELIFIRIVRDMQQSVESSLRAYRDLGYINPVPEGLDVSGNDPVRLIADQVGLIDERITKELASVSDRRVLQWQYEQFCESPYEMTNSLCSLIGVSPNWTDHIFPLAKSTRKKVTDEDSKRIASLLRR